MYGYEDAGERWLPVHTVETVVCIEIATLMRYPAMPGTTDRNIIAQLISVISLLSQNVPDLDSPANVDAAKEVRDNFPCENLELESAKSKSI